MYPKSNGATPWVCPCCGKTYDSVPLTFGSDVPDIYFSIPPEERNERVTLTKSLCVIDGKHFFHRGSLMLPIRGEEEELVFQVWASLSQESYDKRLELWENPKRIKQSPYSCYLQNLIPGYGDTLNLKTLAIEREPDKIPLFMVVEEEHPLAEAQEEGITWERAEEIAVEILSLMHGKNSVWQMAADN